MIGPMSESQPAADITWRVRESAPSSPWRATAGVAIALLAASPFVLAGLAAVEPQLFHLLNFQVSSTLMVWMVVAPWFAGFMLRAAVTLMYPTLTNWLPPFLLRIGIYCGMLTCVTASGVLVAMVGTIGWAAVFAVAPLFLLAQLQGVLRLPQLQRDHAEIEHIRF